MAMTREDILRPDIISIGNRRYRKVVQQHINSCTEENGSSYQHQPYVEEDSYYYDEAESCINEYESIQMTEDGKYKDVVKNIPSFYYKFIIGRGGDKKKNLEYQTKTKISLPQRGCETGNIVIIGKDRGGVLGARDKIKTIIDMNRNDQPANHFLSVPLKSNELYEKLEQFKKDVLDIKARGVDPSIFQIPERLHLTLSLLAFLNDAEIVEHMSTITDTVKNLQKKYLNDTLKLHVSGIEYMNDDPSEVDVLYAKVALAGFKPDRLQSFVDELVTSLASSGIVKKQHDCVKLHATVMNTVFRKDTENSQQKGLYKKERLTFDAQEILKLFSGYDFGEVTVSSLDVSIRGRFDATGYYERAGFVSLSL